MRKIFNISIRIYSNIYLNKVKLNFNKWKIKNETKFNLFYNDIFLYNIVEINR